MNRRQWMMLSGAALARGETAPAQQSQEEKQPDTPDKFLLKDYRPESIYRIPKTEVKKAKFPVIDVHCHGARPPQQVEDIVKLMDSAGVEKTVIFTGASTPERFSEVRQPYAKFPNRFDLWCSFDLAGVNDPGFGQKDRKSTRLNSSHLGISYAVFCLKKNQIQNRSLPSRRDTVHSRTARPTQARR